MPNNPKPTKRLSNPPKANSNNDKSKPILTSITDLASAPGA